MAASNYLEQRMMDFVLNSNGEFSFTSPTNVYIGLFVDSPTDANTGTECSGTDYARVDSGAFSAMTGVLDGTATNTTAIEFPTVGTGGWTTAAYVGLFDAVTGGNLLYHGVLGAPKVLSEADNPKFAVGELSVKMS